MVIKGGAVQFQHRAGDKRYNLDTISRFAEEAEAQGVQILAFPEMCVTGYWHVRNLRRDEIRALAEPVPGGQTTAELSALAKEHRLVLGAGLIEEGEDGRLYNCYAVCLPDGTVHKHRKLHCFISEQMASGREYTVFDTPFGVRLGVLTCWDNNLVENARITALMGAELLLAPHQTGGTASRSPHALGRIDVELWEQREENPEAIEAEFRGDKGRGWLMRWLPARAHDNGMFILFSNGVGRDDDEVRTGNAMAIDCYGRIIKETWKARDELIVADLDLDLIPLSTGRRWLRGRRPELYNPITLADGRELDPRAARFSEEPT